MRATGWRAEQEKTATATFRIGDRAFESQDAFIAGGRRCGTAAFNDFQKARIRSHLATSRAAGFDETTPAPIVVPVHFHVIRDGEQGNVPDDRLNRQIDVLKACYHPHGITFTRTATDRTVNAT